MTPLRRLHNRERIAVAVALGIVVGGLLALAAWTIASNSARISEVQASRLSATQTSCEQQNERHEDLYVGIEATAAHQRVYEPAKYRETVAKARELERLLNAIQPEENCKARAKLLVVQTLDHEQPPPRKPVRRPGPLRLPPPET
jgi:hypothetical protein